MQAEPETRDERQAPFLRSEARARRALASRLRGHGHHGFARLEDEYADALERHLPAEARR